MSEQRVRVPCDCGNPSCPGWMLIPGPAMLGGPRYTLPPGLSHEQIIKHITDCADGKIAPDAEPPKDSP